MIVSEHVVCEELPVWMKLRTVLNSPLINLIGLPLLLEIVVSLY